MIAASRVVLCLIPHNSILLSQQMLADNGRFSSSYTTGERAQESTIVPPKIDPSAGASFPRVNSKNIHHK